MAHDLLDLGFERLIGRGAIEYHRTNSSAASSIWVEADATGRGPEKSGRGDSGLNQVDVVCRYGQVRGSRATIANERRPVPREFLLNIEVPVQDHCALRILLNKTVSDFGGIEADIVIDAAA